MLSVEDAHRHFAGHCFNAAWDLIEKSKRTAADEEAMILAASASLWHWTQRPDCTNQNLSVGHWQLSRIYTLLDQGDNAMHHAQRSLTLAADCAPFYKAYAHEAIARAAKTLGDGATQRQHIDLAKNYAIEVTNTSERDALEQDLNSLTSNL
jgi:hypothetical protein